MPRVGKHFKLHVSIQNHRHSIGVYEDDALLAMFSRIGMMAMERYADRTGNSFLVSSMDLERLAGCRGVANARRKLGRLEAATRLTIGQEGAAYRLTLPNFGKKQGFAPRNEQVITNPSSSSSSSSSTTTTNDTEAAPPPAADAAPGASPVEALERVESLSAAIRESVPGQRVPKTPQERERWAVDLDRLHRLGATGGEAGDGFPWEQIDEVITWLPKHERPGFRWGLVVLSASKFRKHFPRMFAELRAPPKSVADLDRERREREEREFTEEVNRRHAARH